MVEIIRRTLDKSLHMVSSSLDNNLSMLMILCRPVCNQKSNDDTV